MTNSRQVDAGSSRPPAGHALAATAAHVAVASAVVVLVAAVVLVRGALLMIFFAGIVAVFLDSAAYPFRRYFGWPRPAALAAGGFGIIVSDFPRLITDTAASYALRSPLEALHLLDHCAFSSPSAPPSERISALVAGGSAAESESEASPFVERRTPAERYSER